MAAMADIREDTPDTASLLPKDWTARSVRVSFHCVRKRQTAAVLALLALAGLCLVVSQDHAHPWIVAAVKAGLGASEARPDHMTKPAASAPAAASEARPDHRAKPKVTEPSEPKTKMNATEITDKPRGDNRTYQYTKLPNGMQVLNIRDSKTRKTSFAVAIRAGSFDDPVNLPGLAHFCEHMLFLGTKKYPSSKAFSRFMAKSGGYDNAYTARGVTVYFAEVSKEAGPQGVDMFADFFHSPLFNKTFVKKEVHAIDSEHAKNVQSPMRRVIETLNSLGNPDSPVSHFYTGDKSTLYDAPRKNGTSPVDALKVYFKGRYCPPMMRVVTFDSAPLGEQLRMVSEEFGVIPRGSEACGSDKRDFSKPEPWPKSSLGKWMTVKGMQPRAQLWLDFKLPSVQEDFLAQPLAYINHVLDYTGVDSLSRVLQDNLGLADSAQAMTDASSIGTGVYYVVSLTTRGADNPRLVLDVIFSYLARLKAEGVDKELYGSLAAISKLGWDWAEPSGPMDTTSDLAERLTRLPPKHLLSGDSRIDKLDAKLVASLLDRLTPENMNVAYVNPNATNHTLFKGQKIKELPHYGVTYTVELLSEKLPGAAESWSKWLRGEVKSSSIEAHLSRGLKAAGIVPHGLVVPLPPKPIKDVPRHIALDHMKADTSEPGVANMSLLFGPRPRLLRRPRPSPRARARRLAPPRAQGAVGRVNASAAAPAGLILKDPQIWYRSGWVTASPKVTVQVLLRPYKTEDEDDVSALDAMRLGIYGRLLSEELDPIMVDLTAAGVSYEVHSDYSGLHFSFGGFAPLLPRVLKTVLEEFNRFNRNTSITRQSRFKRITTEIRADLQEYTGMPVSYAVSDLKTLLVRGPHSRNEMLAVLGRVSLESAARSAGNVVLSRPLQLTALAMGNLEEGQARDVVDHITRGVELPNWVTLEADHRGGQVEHVTPIVNLTRPVEVRRKNPRPGDPNDAVVVGLVAGVSTVRSRVELGLLGQIIDSLAFEELRTNRQLGYVVSAMSSSISNVGVMAVMVQGTVLKADDVEAAIELVLTKLMPQRLRGLSEKEFRSFVASFREEQLEPPHAPSEELAHFWGPVHDGGRCFGLRDEMLRYLSSSKLTRGRLAEVWSGLATPAEGIRKKIVVKYFADQVPPRPTEQEAKKSWARQMLDATATNLLSRERKRTLILEKADSVTRARLVTEGGFYPKDLICKLTDGDA